MNEKQVLRQRIRQLEGEVVERVRKYYKNHDRYSEQDKTSMFSNIKNPNRKEDQQNTSTTIKKKKLYYDSPQQKSKSIQIPKKKYGLIDDDHLHKSLSKFDQSNKSPISKQTLNMTNLSNSNLIAHYKSEINKLYQENLQLLKQNQAYHRKYSKLERIVLELKQQYENFQTQSQAQNEELLKKLACMEKNILCLKCGQEELLSKIKVYSSKNQLLIKALNDSQESNYQLRLKIQELNHQNFISIQQKPQLQEQLVMWQASQQQISSKVYQALNNLPTTGQDENLLIFEPKDDKELISAVGMIKKFSQSYNQIMELKVQQYKNVIKKFIQIFRNIFKDYSIGKKNIANYLKNAGFDGSQNQEISLLLRGFLKSIKKSKADINQIKSEPSAAQSEDNF